MKKNNHHFEPKLPELVENDEKFDGGNETSDQETEDSKSDQNGKQESDKTLVSTIDTQDTGIWKQMVNSVMNDDSQTNNKQHSTTDSSKLTIKIYPPALQAVASRSPVGSDDATDHQYID